MPNKLFRRRSAPSVYSHRGGLQRRKRVVLKFSIVVGVLASMSALLAITQYSKQLEAMISSKPKTRASAPAEKLIPIAQSLQADNTIKQTTYLDNDLQDILQNWTNTHDGQDWSVVVQEMGGRGRSASIRANSWYVPASIYKVYAAYTVAKHVGLDNIDTINIRVEGQKKTIGQCLDAMLRYSDNPCGEAVAGYVGWWKIENDMHSLGLKNTYLNRKDTNFTTAEDAALFMQKLYNGTLVSGKDQDYILGLLQKQQLRGGIPKGCDSCAVANKTGDLTNVRHDVAIIQSHGKTYILAIFTSGAKYSDIADLTRQINDYMTGRSSKF